jgi:Zn2+/Cd2+-exporting ATPase
VTDVNVSVTAGAMTVLHHAEAMVNIAIPAKLKSLGYKASQVTNLNSVLPLPKHITSSEAGRNDHDHHDHEAHQDSHGHHHELEVGPWWQSLKGKLTIAMLVAVAVAWLVAWQVPEFGSWAYIAAAMVGLLPIAKRAVMAAVNGMLFTIETLMTLASVGAMFIGAAEEAAFVVLLFLIGEMLEGVAAGKARNSIRSLTSLVPSTAYLKDGDSFKEVPAEGLKIGDIIMVPPGDRVPADGTILLGEGSVDEASVTGESIPVRKTIGAKVFAGTVNGETSLQLKVTAAASDNTVARVVRLVEEAQESKAPTERFIDRFSTYYTPAVLAAGVLVAAVPPLMFGGSWHDWLYKGLAILLIGCPCALVISTPAAIASSLSNGARRGLLVKGGAALEGLAKITTAAIDKTGTLTEGKPKVTDVIAVIGTESDVISLAASLEIGSGHPLAEAILAKAEEGGSMVMAAQNVISVGGKGVAGSYFGQALFLGSVTATLEKVTISAELAKQIEALQNDGKTVSVLIADTEISGIIAMRDQARADVKQGLQALRDIGISVVMLTGDNARVANVMAKELGIAVRSELLPAQKLQIVKELQRAGQKVVKVGDGINDAPALAAADIGIAMGGGTDVALETADAAILHERVTDIAEIIKLAKSTMANIRQNIIIALGLKAVFLVTTIIGITGLWPAILADTGATVLVTANAMRLLKLK